MNRRTLTIRIGKRILVPVVALERKLEEARGGSEAGETPGTAR